ncbi:MAG: hypothetical protein A3G07_00665 [Candidatus Doudnabacteria bacterium RIFCSPLOWO2_12_FULL_47_12]|nr:MAG: hypothetical protein A3F44_02300 [Candidatus Doudnabacteria bacterium RIFCSPHIGHO2_12_FULL_47_25]OGF00402.1 MAG: hypothetical protein A3G07_00665 [Candidatus Doudnabacteria bacterium RIFCSPLOWO2_12_FULL_47_12]
MTTLKENMSKAVCLFLAEMLRTRKVKLDRCADIAAEIVNRLESIGSEKQFLDAVKELEFEFQELKTLKNDLLQVTSMSSRQQMEQIVREYAIQILPHDPKQSILLLEEALKSESTLISLSKRFSDFAKFAEDYLESNKKIHA